MVMVDVELMAGIGEQVADLHKRYTAKEGAKPIYKPVGSSFIVPAGATSGQFNVSQGTPVRGRVWNILKVVACGTDGHSPLTQQTFQSNGTFTSPGAGQVITQVTGLPAGNYQVAWIVGLGGTTSATEANNFALNVGATQIITSQSGTGSGSTYPQPNLQVSVPPNGTVSITAVAAGTAGSVYRATLVLTPLGAGLVDVYTGTEQDPAGTPSLDGLILSAANIPSVTWYSRQVEWCSSGEQVLAVLSGVQAGQQVNVIVHVADYAVEEVESVRV